MKVIPVPDFLLFEHGPYCVRDGFPCRRKVAKTLHYVLSRLRKKGGLQPQVIEYAIALLSNGIEPWQTDTFEEELLSVCIDFPYKCRGHGLWGSASTPIFPKNSVIFPHTTNYVYLKDPFVVAFPLPHEERLRRVNALFLHLVLHRRFHETLPPSDAILHSCEYRDKWTQLGEDFVKYAPHRLRQPAKFSHAENCTSDNLTSDKQSLPAHLCSIWAWTIRQQEHLFPSIPSSAMKWIDEPYEDSFVRMSRIPIQRLRTLYEIACIANIDFCCIRLLANCLTAYQVKELRAKLHDHSLENMGRRSLLALAHKILLDHPIVVSRVQPTEEVYYIALFPPCSPVSESEGVVMRSVDSLVEQIVSSQKTTKGNCRIDRSVEMQHEMTGSRQVSWVPLDSEDRERGRIQLTQFFTECFTPPLCKRVSEAFVKCFSDEDFDLTLLYLLTKDEFRDFTRDAGLPDSESRKVWHTLRRIIRFD